MYTRDISYITIAEFEAKFKDRLQSAPKSKRGLVDVMWPFLASLELKYGEKQARIEFWQLVAKYRK